ncbi:MAG: hypothetical protein H6842_03310 [Rhodospirillaceae bacterium]|nr:hypothetical protein [Rhodospirillaceae bacterium]
MIAVFLNNKLITCDSILPVMMEVHRRAPSRPIRFFCFELATFDAIRQNVVLSDGIDRIGSLTLLGRRHRGPLSWLQHRLRVAGMLLPLLLRALVRRVVLIHFKALNEWPLRVLCLIHPRGTYYFQANAAGFSYLDDVVIANLSRQRATDRVIPCGCRIVAFDPNWPELQWPELADRERLVCGTAHNGAAWLDFVTESADRYIAADFELNGVAPQDDIIVLILSHIGRQTTGVDFMAHDDRLPEILAETLDILDEEAPGVPVFLKPHVITDMALLRKILDARCHMPLVITHLHPSALATRARFFIANYYSTTFGAIRQVNGVTIEYTDYAPAVLAATNGGSMRPDLVTHFINNDPEALRQCIRRCLATPRRDFPAPRPPDASGLIDRLCGIEGT